MEATTRKTGLGEGREDRPTIMFLVTHSSPGGVQELWANLAEAFRAAGYRAFLYALYPSDDVANDARSGIHWQYVHSPASSGAIAKFALLSKLARVIRSLDVDLVVTAMPAANVVAPLAARMASKDVKVVTSHHTPVETHNALLDAVDSWTGRMANVRAVISVSNAVASSLEGKASPYRAKRTVINNALPLSIEKTIENLAQLRTQRDPGRRAKVVAIGRLGTQKNYPLLIRAAAQLPLVDIEIVGAGSEETALRALAAELGTSARVTFAGQLPRGKALERLSQGDIFVQVSLFEGHSLALIEAAKLGLPLVVSNVPAQIEGITSKDGVRCGLVVDPHDPQPLVDTINSLASDANLYKSYADLSKRLAADHSFSKMISNYQALFSRVCD